MRQRHSASGSGKDVKIESMKIAVDARCLSMQPTGVGHFLLAAVNVWSEIALKTEFLLLSHKSMHPQAKALLREAGNIKFIECPARFFPDNGLLWYVFHFSKVAKKHGAGYLWGVAGMLPPLIKKDVKSLLTVHDLVYRTHPETMSLRARIAYSLLSGRAIRQADTIWAVSHFTSSQVEQYYPRRRGKMPVICGSGLNPLRSSRVPPSSYVQEIASKYGVNDRTLLFVGTLEPRKNLAFLLSLMPKLATRGVRLIVAGCSGWGRSNIAEVVGTPGFPVDAVYFCKYLPDEELQALYRSVAFFISTALMEGFGLPHLEAMAVGCPVIAANNSAVAEVVRGGGRLISGWDPDSWIDEIMKALTEREAVASGALNNAREHDMGFVCAQVQRRILDL